MSLTISLPGQAASQSNINNEHTEQHVHSYGAIHSIMTTLNNTEQCIHRILKYVLSNVWYNVSNTHETSTNT